MDLSLRAQAAGKPTPGVSLWDILQNLWDPDTNTSGFVSLGVAENTLMHDDILKHIHASLSLTSKNLTYGDGSKRLRAAMSRFLTRQLAPVEPIEPGHILLTNGCSSAIEHLSWALANPGEAFLLAQPYYCTFPMDITLRTGVHVVPVPFEGVDPFSVGCVEMYEEALVQAQLGGTRIAGLILCSPHNPLGRCYPREVLLRLMALCEKHGIHLVSDEIYALSVWENTVDEHPPASPFESCLSVPSEGVIDPSRLHVLWGMSKDFGANGLRVGAIISQHNPALHAALGPVSLYSSVSQMSENATASILEDEAWHDEYLANNRRKLSSCYEIAASWAKENGIPYSKGVNAALFLWVDLGAAYVARHPEAAGVDVDTIVMQALLKKKVYLAMGKDFGSEVPGWFRIVFSHPEEYLRMGLQRTIEALE
ncbi:related to 1-aminocyclopropane-2-carboxylate synthase 2 [Cephalotrichum gorgonifer]|uniref:Related to 1-aminocyclopropane-2-carboxylate synthase 2 n=1 Tax=Cephalotrichum gorgonifer TaxID=2041049 RepID=A0AAE8SYY7_9PEZI|nr:related to 1-aminocyclopropane-2-carboxylate synthase 2 [Cephalotrichum gorgonifer]